MPDLQIFGYATVVLLIYEGFCLNTKSCHYEHDVLIGPH